MAAEEEIPDKLHFRIGEVAKLANLPPYVLRFWETEFSQLKPVKSSTGHRLYRRRDVEILLQIKKLLHVQGYTIAGAKQYLKAQGKAERAQSDLPFPPVQGDPREKLQKIQRELRDILTILTAKR